MLPKTQSRFPSSVYSLKEKPRASLIPSAPPISGENLEKSGVVFPISFRNLALVRWVISFVTVNFPCAATPFAWTKLAKEKSQWVSFFFLLLLLSLFVIITYRPRGWDAGIPCGASFAFAASSEAISLTRDPSYSFARYAMMWFIWSVIKEKKNIKCWEQWRKEEAWKVTSGFKSGNAWADHTSQIEWFMPIYVTLRSQTAATTRTNSLVLPTIPTGASTVDHGPDAPHQGGAHPKSRVTWANP